MEKFKDQLKVLEQRMNEGHSSQSATYVRPVHRPRSLPTEALQGRKHHGFVCDLGFVDDEDSAKLLSWAAGTYMDAVIVDDTKEANELYHMKIKSWALDQMEHFQVTVLGSDGLVCHFFNLSSLMK